MEEKSEHNTEKIAIITLSVITAIIILALVIALTVMHAQKMEKIKQAVLYDCLDEVNEDYVILIQKCEARASDFKGAEFYLVWIYTEEDGMEVMYVRYYEDIAEVFEQ